MITTEVFVSFLHCDRKAFLKAAGTSGTPADIEAVELGLDRLYQPRARDVFLAAYGERDMVRDPPSLEEALRGRPRAVADVTAVAGDLSARVHVLERVKPANGRGAPAYAPVLFVRNEKVARSDKLLLAFQALVLSASLPPAPVARIVHGSGHRVTKVRVDRLAGEVRGLLSRIRALQAAAAPRVTLNVHCGACEFHRDCRRLAEEADDLSLLRGLTRKKVEELRGRGVTTVTQFSHTYRPGRRGKRRSGKARRHDPALQALAFREKKVYVMDGPTLPGAGAAVYLDVEGVPDRDFYYLIGLAVVRDGCCTPYSFWADDAGRKKAAWDACLRVLDGLGEYTLYHYGRYEQHFFEHMRRRATGEEEVAALDRVRARSCNVLAAIYSHVYFPTWSNGLKDVAGLLGAVWTDAGASGLQSLAWRLAWEAGGGEDLKERLVRYNREDCLALRRVTEFVGSLCEGARPADGAPAVASAQEIRPATAFHFGKPAFFCPELAAINRCAYSDYQRERVYVRTSPAMRASLRRRERARTKRLRVNEEVEYARPEVCPACGGTRVHLFGRSTAKTIFDLKFTSTGVKRWVVRYHSARYRCWDCRGTFLPDGYRAAGRRPGDNLSAWAIYQHVALRQSYEDVALSLNELFGFSFGETVLGRIKPRAAERYRATYDRLKERLRLGTLVHADETSVRLLGGGGYVWAFTNLEEVVYVYTPTREGTILQEMLDGFTGVLVSDFYAAYDAARCAQQKCLVHLTRDINDDLFHRPFDEELKELAQRLVGVLKPVIDTVDRYGLKRRHLNKHKEDVARFFRYLEGRAYESEVARKYQKRMVKYRDKLFVFLDHDGVPWNNNNAENAIKRFASRRRIIGASSTERGLRDYLLFLSLYQTCRHKNVSFLRFLCSGEVDIDAFAERQGRRR